MPKQNHACCTDRQSEHAVPEFTEVRAYV